MIDIVEFTNFLIKHKLTANQFFLLYITMIKRYDLMYQFLESLKVGNREMYDISGGIPAYEIENLEERGYLVNLDKSDNKYLDSFLVTDKFSKSFNNTLNFEDADEFWNEYPEYIDINGKKVRTKSINKDKFRIEYTNVTKHKGEIHTQIMKKLRYDKVHNLISSGIQKYFDGRPWETFDETKILTNNDLI